MCAWLVAHRGHFLFDIDAAQTDKVLNFDSICRDFQEYLEDLGYTAPWDIISSAPALSDILQMDAGVNKKKEAFKEKLFSGKKISKERELKIITLT